MNNTANNTLTIESVRPQDLGHKDFVRISEVSQDMWASEAWLGELAQCTSCGKMHSKEDVFSGLPKDLFQKTVAEIMREIDMKEILCHGCGHETRMIYGPENVEMVKERVLRSVDSFLVLCTDTNNKIVGFEEWYIDSLKKIFDRDLYYHYSRIGFAEVSKRVDKILGYTPENMLILSSIGLMEEYRSFPNLFEMLNQFSRAIPDKYLDIPGVTELDKDGVIHRMSEGISRGVSLGSSDDLNWHGNLVNIGKNYNSDLVVYHDPVRVYKENFTNWVRHFMRVARAGAKPVHAPSPQIVLSTEVPASSEVLAYVS